MAIAAGGWWQLSRNVCLLRNVCWLSVLALALAVGCTKKEAPELAPAAAPPPPPPPAPVVRDAAVEVGDAATDAADAGGGGRKWVGLPATGAAGAGAGALRVEGSLSRADGDKVIRAAQPKLRACFEAANEKGSGQKGRVSFKLTTNDRGHVTLTEIPTSSLPGGSGVETCMVHVLRDLRFPRASGESTLSFQMTFGR
jgi:hypothetical protein